MPAYGCFIFGLNVDYIQTLEFAQNYDLDISEHTVFNLDILVVYDAIEYFTIFGWLFHPLRFHSVEYIQFQ